MEFATQNTLPKLIVIPLLAIASYYVIICPCDTLVACHFRVVTTALSGALATILFLNAGNPANLH